MKLIITFKGGAVKNITMQTSLQVTQKTGELYIFKLTILPFRNNFMSLSRLFILLILSNWSYGQNLKETYSNGHGGMLEIVDYQPKQSIKVHLIYKSDVCDLDIIATLQFSTEVKEGLIFENDNVDYLRINGSSIQFYPGSLGEGDDFECDNSYEDRYK